MGLFRRKPVSPTRADRRIALVETGDLPMWIENCIYEAGRAFTAFKKDSVRDHLIDAMDAVTVLGAALSSYHDRMERMQAFSEPPTSSDSKLAPDVEKALKKFHDLQTQAAAGMATQED